MYLFRYSRLLKVELRDLVTVRLSTLVLLATSTISPSAVLAQNATSGSTTFPEIYNSESEPGEPISPQQALESLHLPSDFHTTLFASEPEVQNPIAACTDPRGRVWVAENYTYAERSQKFDLDLNDRIVVLEDSDGDGVSDKRTVFSDQLKMLTGITVGRGGVWVTCPPQLLFIPDRDGDLRPDGPPEVKLDGFHVASENYHNFANGLSWGPDNWLYGRCGASCPGEMGLPGSTDEQRVPLRGGMWRYHPELKIVEALNQGTTNPWGHDWNKFGDLFFINTVNGHLWHSIPGAHYVRPHTLDANPHVYELIDMHADHWHFDTGKSWTASRDGAANDYGGGHAHIGMMIYQENRWPAEYRGSLLTVNMHGRRINREHLHREGSGYVATHGKDFALSDDLWFRGMELLPTPEGNVLLFDWSDTGECHDHTGVHRKSGRIFKITYRSERANQSRRTNPFQDTSLRTKPMDLAQLQITGTTWESRRARELLAELYLQGAPVERAIEFLRSKISSRTTPAPIRLRALWTLNAIGGAASPLLETLLVDKNEYVRSWALRLLTDRWALDYCTGIQPERDDLLPDSELVSLVVRTAAMEKSPSVRLTYASTLQRLPLDRRAELASALTQHASDADDHNLPQMVWYGLSPLADKNLADLVDAVEHSTWPTTTRLVARRIADRIDVSPSALDKLVSNTSTSNQQHQEAVVKGIAEALAGRRKVVRPKNWDRLQSALSSGSDTALRSSLQSLSIIFGDGRTVDELASVASDNNAELELRMAALQTLVDSRAEGIEDLCLKLLNVRFLNSIAAAGLSRRATPDTGDAIVKAYRRFHPSERPQAISVLSTRKPWARALLQSVLNGQIDRGDITAFNARQISSLGDDSLDALLVKAWGQVRESSAERIELKEKLRSQLTADRLAQSDKTHGRQLFQKSCSSCHTMFGTGGKLGPDLTGAQRSNLGYLLDNIVDPSAVVTKEFRATVLLLEDGRVLTGLLTSQTDTTFTLATQEKTFTIPSGDVVEQKVSDMSTMPDGLLSQLSDADIRDLFSYLQSTEQVPLQ